MATLHELKTIYSLYDAWCLNEAIMVPKENENRAYYAAEAEAKGKTP